MAMPSPSPLMDQPRHRLPTLFEVLSRRTLPPVDLYSFYIHMRDQQRSVDYLDFWLDVAQHMSLCRHYVRELRRSVLVETPEHEKAPTINGRRDSLMLEQVGSVNEPAGPSMYQTTEERAQDQRLSAFLRSQNNNNGSNNGGGGGGGAAGRASPGSEKTGRNRSSSDQRYRRSSLMTMTPDRRTDSDSPEHTVTRADLRASAEKILYTFLLPGSEREIILPDSITSRIINTVEQDNRVDPEVFDAAKNYVFQAMERDAFPGFLRAKALSNLVPPSMMLRLIFGMLCLFGAFWSAFALLFLNYGKSSRLWLIIPFALGTYALASHQYALDPVLALLGLSEYTFMSFARVHEHFVRQLLNKRALMVLAVTLLTVTALVVLFVLVPGKRL
ncbi:MAG: Bud site selection protein, Revert to axial protein 1 [Peltula sp. TS41687]|nr:MAG: Bud site selection protein, Revert to axial protein 1 [Peltula sp. TS41687]